jgi:hypothetical protein
MPKSLAMQMLDEMLASRISPLMAAEGFTKMHRTYVRKRGTRWDIVALQVSRYGTAVDTRFTFNIGRHDERREDRQARRWTKYPRHCSDGNHRIGAFSEHKGWWSLNAESDLTTIGDELESVMRTAVLPYLDGTRSVTGR